MPPRSALRVSVALEVAVVLALATLTALYAALPLIHDDLFFHLRTGELVLASGTVPRTETFTHTLPGAAWTSHEWGFGVLCQLVYRGFGYVGLVHLTQVLAVLVFAVLYFTMRRLVRPSRVWLLAPLSLAWLAAVAEPLLMLRAALLSTLALGVLSYLLVRLHETRAWRWELLIVVLVLIWSNVHVGVVYGLAVLGLHVLQVAFDDLRAGARPDLTALKSGLLPRRSALLALCAAISLTTPNGLDLWRFPFLVNRLMFHSGLTWDLGHFAAPTPATYPGFFALVALVLMCCLPLRRTRLELGRKGTFTLTLAASAALFAWMSVRFSRAIPDFAMFALPFCVALRAGRGDSLVAPASALDGPRVGLLGQAASVLLTGIALVFAPSFPTQPLAPNVPIGAAAFLARERIEGRMFNYEASGGYLGFALRKPVYWDGRNDVFLPLALELAHAPSFGALVERHRLQVLVLNPTYQARFGAQLAALPVPFGLVYFDRVSAIYVARTQEHAALLARAEYRYLQPFQVPSDATLSEIAAEPTGRALVEAEARRLLAQHGDAFIAHYVLGGLLQARGLAAQGEAELEQAQQLSSDDAHLLYKRALIARELGRSEQARALLERAIALGAH
jgi:hypothetical protein